MSQTDSAYKHAYRRASRMGWTPLMWLLTTVIVIALVSGRSQAETPSNLTWPKQIIGQGAAGVAFVDNGVCKQCHPRPFQDWMGSHHERSMQAANEKTVLGDFR